MLVYIHADLGDLRSHGLVSRYRAYSAYTHEIFFVLWYSSFWDQSNISIWAPTSCKYMTSLNRSYDQWQILGIAIGRLLIAWAEPESKGWLGSPWPPRSWGDVHEHDRLQQGPAAVLLLDCGQTARVYRQCWFGLAIPRTGNLSTLSKLKVL
jgi:hypothetical protein